MAGKRHPSHRCAIARIAVARPWMCRHFILLSLFIAIKRKGNEKRPLYPKSFTLVSSCIEESVKKKKKKKLECLVRTQIQICRVLFQALFQVLRVQVPRQVPTTVENAPVWKVRQSPHQLTGSGRTSPASPTRSGERAWGWRRSKRQW